MGPLQILLVEDSSDIVALVRDRLSEFGRDAELSVETNCDRGLRELSTGSYSVALLDVMLPDGSGVELCRQARLAGTQTPIIILTGRQEFELVSEALDAGADDYLTKPFSIPELFARMRAVLRRTTSATDTPASVRAEEQIFQFGSCQLDVLRREFRRESELVKLTVSEFELLLVFLQSAGQVLSRDDLLTRVWGYQHQGYENNVNSHITRLRKKLTANNDLEKYIQTVWGVGYRFVVDASDQ